MSFQKKILKTLTELKKSNPKCSVGKHIATAVDSINMSDLWAISDKELHNSLLEYQVSLDMDIMHDDDDIDKIIEGGKNLWADEY